ncbi:phosphoribosyl-ATP diphosphatase [Marinivivus vitaminiproducens]|uniref:phosphoribosyl-ATP diphosphatase n=1 Tax=Marinivivus vitaminiproducens TaxID=3035935 RepID=UPI0027A164C1|nr:phosphoribosyl-ATP diphosphatase [Geminicoccaceae bacterium SCSIO 64248]
MPKKLERKKPQKTVGNGESAPFEDRLSLLADDIALRRLSDAAESRFQKLIAGGTPKMAQKVVEEAAEVAIDAVQGNRAAVINEAADLFFNLTVLLSEIGIPPSEIWAEMDRRRTLYGIAEKLPKVPADINDG